jgi:hypothetical protein
VESGVFPKPKALNFCTVQLRVFFFWCRRLTKGVEYLVEASAAEAEAISATLAAVKARQNGEMEQLPDRDGSSEATPSGKQTSLIKVPEPVLQNNISNSIPPPGVRLHHRAVSFFLIIIHELP